MAAIAISGLVSAFIALPLLPERDLQGSATIALNNAQGETVGWPRFLDAVSTAWHKVPPAERAHTAIFTANYGEAGAIDILGSSRLPRAYSGHNAFSEWGRPPAADTYVLLVGYQNAAAAAPDFGGCHTLATVNNGVGLNNQEQGNPVMLCRPTRPWPVLWPRLRHYD